MSKTTFPSAEGVVNDVVEEVSSINLPGLHLLREAVENRAWRKLPKKMSIRRNMLAGLTMAISEVPDGMANGLLVGVNPIYGLYACMIGPIVGGLFSSTQLMVTVTTSAASLTAGEALSGLSGEARAETLFLMVSLSGIFQILLGFIGASRLTRFVSYSVMTGVLTGVGVLLALSQLPTAMGYAAEGANAIGRALDTVTHLTEVSFSSVAIATLTLALTLTLPRTKLGRFGILFAVLIPSVVAATLGLEGVKVVRDVSGASLSLPTPALPSLSNFFQALTGAFAVSAVILVQGAGVSQSVPNHDDSRSQPSRDFIAQGAANLASGLFRGLPVGGSLSATTLNVVSGANRRWATVFTGIWLMVLILLFSRWVLYIAMPALGALLIHVGIQSVRRSEFLSIWSAGWPSRIACLATFLSILFFPIQIAVTIGVVISALLYMYRSASDISIVELVKRSDGRIEERAPPGKLKSNDTTVLDIYGHLFYAGARTLETLLPDPHDVENPGVIIRLRGRQTIGATLIDVLSDYSEKLKHLNGRLYLSGITEQAKQQLVGSGKLDLSGPVNIFNMTPVIGESTKLAHAQAEAWLFSLKGNENINPRPTR